MQQTLKIGSRGSPLAMVQARLVQRLIGESRGLAEAEYDAHIPIHVFTTTGDVLTGRLSQSGGKGLFVKELDEALADGRIDLAVHSMKDVPTALDPIFALTAILPREDPRDAFISLNAKSLMDLPEGAVLGTASLRRQAQAARLRPDLKMALLRGNVGTRLSRLGAGDCAATFLAVAGLNRLGQSDVITQYIEPEIMLSAPAQGAVGIQIRRADKDIAAQLSALHDPETALAITAERAFLKALDGSCRTPIAALAQIDGKQLRFRGQALSPDGRHSFERDVIISIPADYSDEAQRDAYALGYSLGAEIRNEAGSAIQWDEF